jgi:hypothetical protein
MCLWKVPWDRGLPQKAAPPLLPPPLPRRLVQNPLCCACANRCTMLASSWTDSGRAGNQETTYIIAIGPALSAISNSALPTCEQGPCAAAAMPMRLCQLGAGWMDSPVAGSQQQACLRYLAGWLPAWRFRPTSTVPDHLMQRRSGQANGPMPFIGGVSNCAAQLINPPNTWPLRWPTAIVSLCRAVLCFGAGHCRSKLNRGSSCH